MHLQLEINLYILREILICDIIEHCWCQLSGIQRKQKPNIEEWPEASMPCLDVDISKVGYVTTIDHNSVQILAD